MARVKPGRAVLRPNLGLYLGVPRIDVPERGLVDCINVRVKQGRIVRDNLGWSNFQVDGANVNLDGRPVLLIDRFDPRNAVARSIFGNTTDLFALNLAGTALEYITPRYQTGTVAVTNGDPNVAGTGTTWLTNVKAGDFIHIGAIDQVNPAATWYQVQSVTTDTALVLTTNYAGATDSGLAYTARQNFTGTIRNPWQSEPFYSGVNHTQGSDGDRWYATNGVDNIVAWDGSTSQVYKLTSLNSANFLRRFNNIMVYGNIEVAGNNLQFSVRTSAIGEPENVTTLEAAEFVVHGGSDPLLTAMPLGDLLAVYGERSITLMQFVGQPLMFVFRTVVSGYGPRSARTVAQFGSHHVFVGADSQYRFDGASVVPVNKHVWREVVRTTSPQRLDLFHAHFDEEQGELLWVTPLTTDADPDDGAPEKAYVQHYLEETGERSPEAFTVRELPALCFGFFQQETTLTWDQLSEAWTEYNVRWNDQSLQEAFPQVLFGDINGSIFVLNDSNTKAGAAMTSRVHFSRRPLGDVLNKGLVSRIYPFLEQVVGSAGSVNVRLWIADRVDGTQTPASILPIAVDNPGRNHFVSPRKVGRYGEVEFYTDTYAGYWAVTGYDMQLRRAGT